MDITIQELTGDNPDALALLAWHELVEEAEKGLPLLVMDSHILKGDALVKKLRKLSRGLSCVQA